MIIKNGRTIVLASLGFTLLGCQAEHAGNGAATSDIAETELVWAMNVAGDSFTAIDGTEYKAEESVSGGESGWQDEVKGSQDEFIYQSYREGDVAVTHPVANGVYDLTLKFTEPRDFGGKERIFDAYAEDQLIVDDLDIMVSRDGKVRSALSVTVADIAVTDGELNISFVASVGEPVLNAVVLRRKVQPAQKGKLLWSDEFDYAGAPDPELWTADIWPARKVNDEDQAYTERSQNLRVEDGMLIIEAFKESYDNAEYTSGRLHSADKGDLLYGRVEVRAKLPAGKGSWPAIWMLPSNPFTYATTCEPGYRLAR